MTKKKHKLHLRKEVLRIIPVFIFILFVGTALYINKKNLTKKEVPANEVLASNKLSKVKSKANLSDLKYINQFENMMEQRQKDNTIIYYAQIFKLNVPKALELAHKFTNNYKDENYLKSFIIGPTGIQNKTTPFKSFEAGAAYFARDIYRYPEKYGTSISEMRLDETPTKKVVAKDGNIYMNNGMTFEQYMGKISDLFGVDAATALAISYHEAGIKKSFLFTDCNNIGGHRGYDGWMRFTTLEAGVISHVLTIKAMQDNYNLDLNTIEGLAGLSGIYVNGRVSKPAESWLNKIQIFKREIYEQHLTSYK